MKKTSQTHPLCIDTIPAGSFGGLIGKPCFAMIANAGAPV